MTRQPLGVATAKTRRPTVWAANAVCFGAAAEHRVPSRRAPIPARDVMLRPCRDAPVHASALALDLREILDHDRPFARRALERLDDEPLRLLPGVRRKRPARRATRSRPRAAVSGSPSRLALPALADSRASAPDLEHARAERVGHQHVAAPARTRYNRPAYCPAPEISRAARADRSSRRPARRTIAWTRCKPFDRLQARRGRRAPVRILLAFDQGEAEVARQQRVLEVGLVVCRAGRQQYDAGRGRRRRAAPSAARPEAQGAEERGRDAARGSSRNICGKTRDTIKRFSSA